MEKDKKIFEKYCKKYSFDHIPPILKFPKNRIVAIGDIHGDIKMLKKVLIKAKVIDDRDNWISYGTYVVQVGDQIDDLRPPEKNTKMDNVDVDVLTYTNELHVKALEKQSMFISLLGNHEILNILSYENDNNIEHVKKYLTYVSKNSIDIFSESSANENSGYMNRAKLFNPGNTFAKLLACTRLPVVVIGKYIFMHAGITNSTLDYLQINNKNKLFEIQYIIRKFLLGLTNDKKEKEIVKNILTSDIFWTRILNEIPQDESLNNEECEKYISRVMKLLSLKSIIIGHTSNKLKMSCNNRIIHLNSMNSSAFDIFKNNGFEIESPTALQISKDEVLSIIKV